MKFIHSSITHTYIYFFVDIYFYIQIHFHIIFHTQFLHTKISENFHFFSFYFLIFYFIHDSQVPHYIIFTDAQIYTYYICAQIRVQRYIHGYICRYFCSNEFYISTHTHTKLDIHTHTRVQTPTNRLYLFRVYIFFSHSSTPIKLRIILLGSA